MSIAHLSPFEKAVIRVVDYLVDNKHIHQKFRHKSDLLKALHLSIGDWSKYKKGIRNIPDNEGENSTGKHKHIRQYLINEFDVNPGYLEGKSTQMFIKPLIPDDIPGTPEKQIVVTQAMWDTKVKENEALKKENAQLTKEKGELLQKIVELQDKLIEAMNSSTKNGLHKVGE